MQKKQLVGVVIALVAVAAIFGVVLANNASKPEPATTQPSTSAPAETTDSGQGSNNSGSGSDEDKEEVKGTTVEIKDFNFSPATITVKKGTKVTWTNKDSVQHDVQPDDESEAFQGSELLGEGESYSFTFNTVGSFSYHCTPHPQMQGTVVVTE